MTVPIPSSADEDVCVSRNELQTLDSVVMSCRDPLDAFELGKDLFCALVVESYLNIIGP